MSRIEFVPNLHARDISKVTADRYEGTGVPEDLLLEVLGKEVCERHIHLKVLIIRHLPAGASVDVIALLNPDEPDKLKQKHISIGTITALNS